MRQEKGVCEGWREKEERGGGEKKQLRRGREGGNEQSVR